MAQVIELHPKRIWVPALNPDKFTAEMLALLTVTAIDPHIMSSGELLEATSLHQPTCACSFCEEVALRDMEGTL